MADPKKDQYIPMNTPGHDCPGCPAEPICAALNLVAENIGIFTAMLIDHGIRSGQLRALPCTDIDIQDLLNGPPTPETSQRLGDAITTFATNENIIALANDGISVCYYIITNGQHTVPVDEVPPVPSLSEIGYPGQPAPPPINPIDFLAHLLNGGGPGPIGPYDDFDFD